MSSRLLTFNSNQKLLTQTSCPLNYHVCNVHGLDFSVGCYGDVSELDKFFDVRKYGTDKVSRMVCHLLEDVLTLKDFVGNKLNVVFLEVSDHVRHGVVDGVRCLIADIREIRLLEPVNLFCMRVCSTPVTSRKRSTSSVWDIHMFEFAWAVVLSRITSRPR